MPYLWAAVQTLAAYILIDLCTGIYHYVTDRGWNFKGQVEMFRDHHDTNTMQGFDWQPMVAGVPVMFAGLWLESSFLIAAGAFAILAQVPHYWAHRGSRFAAVKWLQASGLVISPEHHAAHHEGKFNRNFCILSGWNDWWLNLIVGGRP